ncbi:MAG: hypothetical protein AB1Z65_11650 [Candidatus Sulfomarinibacteraceae bacterium]
MTSHRLMFLVGLFLTTCATLQIEVLATRLLSVIAWYHLAFLAVSIAMLGMAGGAVRAYLGKDLFNTENAPRALARYSFLFGVSIPVCHVINLCVPIQLSATPNVVAAIALTVVVLTIPFYLSGIVVTVALTRVPGPTGLVYAIDLLGAAAGCVLVIPLLNSWSISAATMLCAAVALIGAMCFQVVAETGRELRMAILAVLLVVSAFVNDTGPYGLRIAWSKGLHQAPHDIVAERWTGHGLVTAYRPVVGRPQYWGEGRDAPDIEVSVIWMTIDGLAGTSMTSWDRRRESLDWIAHDVTSLAYHLRRGKDVAVIGVGGGRDLLSALWSRARSITGIEINRGFLDLLTGDLSEFAGISGQPEIVLEHDEARSFLTRTDLRFDLVQMSMIDSWAATGAGAFTLSENGLYTTQGWQALLRTLRPDGLLTVSRWYSSERPFELGRLVALATAALLERGVSQPDKHILVVARDRVASLVLALQPFTPGEIDTISRVAGAEGFTVLVAPGFTRGDPLLSGLSRCRTPDELLSRAEHDVYDLRPPTDERPYFFNILKPGGVFLGTFSKDQLGVIGAGNLAATLILLLLWCITATGVVGTIVVPLVRAGVPRMAGTAFAGAVVYFALIGMGFMFVQIPLLQRFSVYLGHPTYALAVILFSMILFAGFGSLASDRLANNDLQRALAILPATALALLLVGVSILQPLIDRTISLGLVGRCAVVTAFVGVISFPLGFFFPLGLRAVRRISDDATPWLWGINGAAGVLAGVSAVAVSMWWGISAALLLAATAYALLYLPLWAIFKTGALRGPSG